MSGPGGEDVVKSLIESYQAGGQHTADILGSIASLESLQKARDAASKAGARLQADGDLVGEAFMLLVLGQVLATQGLIDEAVKPAKQARRQFQQLGSLDGEKMAVILITEIHEEKDLDPPSSVFRTQALSILSKVTTAVQDRNGGFFEKTMTELYEEACGLFTVADFKAAVSSSLDQDREGTMNFLEEFEAFEVVLRLLSDLKGIIYQAGQTGEKKEGVTSYYFKHNQMYAGIRLGEALVYGPRFRCIRGWGTTVGKTIVASSVRPSSLAEAWEVEGYEWNACAIDAAVHASFGMQTIAGN